MIAHTEFIRYTLEALTRKEKRMIKGVLVLLAVLLLWVPGTVQAQTKCKLATAWSATSFDEKECLSMPRKPCVRPAIIGISR